MSTKSARAQYREARYNRLLKREQVLSRLTESVSPFTDSGWGSYVPYPYDMVGDAYRSMGAYPRQNAQDTNRGAAHGVFTTEEQLAESRNMAMIVGDSNLFAVGAINGLVTYIAGDGFVYEAFVKSGCENVPGVTELVKEVQKVNDEFDEENVWCEWESEIIRETVIIGEHLLRHTPDDDMLLVRNILPEQNTNPPLGYEDDDEWSFGWRCSRDDQHVPNAAWVTYTGDTRDGEEVPAEDIEHCKRNVRRGVRRGLTDLYPVGENAQDLTTLIRNMRRGASVLATIAWIEQFENATQDQVRDFSNSKANLTKTNPETGRTDRLERRQPGEIVRIPKGKEYVAPPFATANVPGWVEICRMCRTALCARWNAPESLLGDASNGNFSSLAVAESPFVHSAESRQQFHARRFKRTKIRVINHAIAIGRLPANTLDLVDISVEAPPVIVRDRLQLTTEREKKLANGIISPQTWASQDGEDWEKEQAQRAAAVKLGWVPPLPPGSLPPPVPGAPLSPVMGAPTFEAVESVLAGLGHWG